MKQLLFSVYIAECADHTYYVGQTDNVKLCEKEHNGLGKIPGPKYTEARRPVKMVHIEEYQTREFATQREKELKKLTQKQMLDLINCLAIY
ncbi:MAG: GIY-YIG nuclease family protein [Candidatus Levybacteria bacterium]|nr:GIY-YIG nuclease family protein [Candidatus Levybacteria bacterium]